MIKFIPLHTNNNTGTIGSYLENIAAIGESKLCAQLNSKEINTECHKPDCKGVESVVTVSTEDGIKFAIGNYCCEDFRVELTRFLQLEAR